jgi:hypothetical protein
MFLQIFGLFFKHLNIDVVNILILFFWLIEFVYITKIIPNPEKMGDILKIFWNTFSSPNDITQITFKS